MIIDSHCHILSTEYDDNETIIKNNFDKLLIISGVDLKSSIEAVCLAKKYDNVYATIGIGPENVKDFDDKIYKELEKLSENEKVVAIGEIGLDYYWTANNKNKQKQVFNKMLNLAKLKNKPVIIHSRNSTCDIINILKNAEVNGIMHCFSGSLETAKILTKMGFLISISGVVTFKNSKQINDVVKNLPLSSLCIETDSPYLSPEPNRGKLNTPENLIYTISKIAEIKNVSVEEVINQTYLNISSKFDLKR